MAFADDAAAMMEVIFDSIGVPGTFSPATGDDVSLQVAVNREVVQQGFDATAWTSETTIEAILTDLPHEPNRGETFTVGDTTYTVREVMENDGYTVKVVVR